MGLFDILQEILFSVANTAKKDVERKTAKFDSGYQEGSRKASSMSDAELRSSLKNARENGFSSMKDAGGARAMADEYKNRKK